MSITAADVKKLRDATGAGMMDAKKALTEAVGDFEKAIEILRISGAAKAAKRGAEREASSGLVAMHGSRDEHRRPRPLAVQDVHGQRDRGVVGQSGDGDVHQAALAGRHGDPADGEGPCGHWLPTADGPLPVTSAAAPRSRSPSARAPSNPPRSPNPTRSASCTWAWRRGLRRPSAASRSTS